MGIAPELWIKAEIVRGESVGVCCYRNQLTTVPIISGGASKGIVGLKRWVNYSYLKAIIGSIFIARLAGT